MTKKKTKLLFPLLISSLLLVSGCNANPNSATENQEDIVSQLVSYKDNDDYTSWEGGQFTYINLEGATATVDGEDGVIVEDKQILIRTSGTYVIKGTLDDGQIIVNAEDSGNVRLILNGATINSSTSAPIFIKQADKTIISLEKGTENSLSDATEYVYENDSTDEPSATIYSKDDLTINGSGTLTIKGNFNDGIKSNDDLKVTGGTLNVTAVDDGIVGKDLLAIKDSTMTVTADGDGLKASNAEDEAKGNIALENSKLTIKADGDGIQAEKVVAIANGEYTITTGGGSPETIETSEDDMGGKGPGNFDPQDMESMVDRFLAGIDVSDELKEKLKNAENMEEIQTILQDYPDVLEQIQESDTMRGPGMQMDAPPNNSNENTFQPPDSSTDQRPQTGGTGDSPTTQEKTPENDQTETAKDDSISTKGIKAGTELYISGGQLKIDSLDDALHSNQNVTISGGTINISTGEDGIHGDQDVLLNGGNVSIDKSYEGIEGINITINDGTYHVVAEDDGININGGSDEFGMPGGFGNMTPPGTDPATSEKSENSKATTENNDRNSNPENDTANKTEEDSTDEGLLLINGGYLLVNANGDGLDSNASIKMTDGTVIVYGPTDNGNGPLDYEDSFILEGGTLIASGSSGMAQGISEESSQPAIMMNYSEFQEANTAVYITSEQGAEVMAIAPEKQFQSILISTPDLKTNQTYTFHSGGVLTGDHENGLYQDANYKEGTLSVEFPISTIMTYLNEDGVTEGNSNGMMGGNPFDRGNGGEGKEPFGKDQNSEPTSKNKE